MKTALYASGLCLFTTLVFFFLKIFGVWTMPWLWVLSPMWIFGFLGSVTTFVASILLAKMKDFFVPQGDNEGLPMCDGYDESLTQIPF